MANASLRALLVDDEALARQRLARLLAPFVEEGRIDIVGEAGDGVEALDLAEQEKADVLFLDIRMPGPDGFAVAERLPPPRPHVVFVTAYNDHAVDAFRANAVDYLLKPVEADRLAETVARVEALVHDAEAPARDRYLDRVADLLESLEQRTEEPTRPAEGEYLRQLSIPGRDKFTVVPVARLVAAEVQDGLTSLYVLDEAAPGAAPTVSRHVLTTPLDALEARLDPVHFMRVHRSALVNLDHIREMLSWFSGRYKLLMTGGHEVLASRSRSRALRDRLTL